MKSITSARRIAPILPSTSPLQHSQLLCELLRSVVTRSEDIWTLRSLSDKTGKAKTSSLAAEKLLAEAELREEWRLLREENLLSTLGTARVDNAIQKK